MTDLEIRHKVLEFATKAHEGQTRWDKAIPYITHPIAVAELASKSREYRYLNSQGKLELYIVCACHDIAEDCDITLDQIEEFLRSLDPKREYFDTGAVIHALDKITKTEDDKGNYLGYILRVKSSYLSKICKIFDLQHNMSDLKKGSMLDKYQLAHYILVQGTSMATKRTK